MAFNPHPEVQAAREFAKQFDKDIVVILHVDFKRGKFGFASYGKDRTLCDRAEKLGDTIYKQIEQGKIIP